MVNFRNQVAFTSTSGDNNSPIFQVFLQFLDVSCVRFLNTELLFVFIRLVGHDQANKTTKCSQIKKTKQKKKKQVRYVCHARFVYAPWESHNTPLT